MFIVLQWRLDRLGAQIMSYLSQICIAFHSDLYIQYDRQDASFRQSIFVKVLFDLVDEHNQKLTNETFTRRVDLTESNKYVTHGLFSNSRCVLHIQNDIISYIRGFQIRTRFLEYATKRNYQLPFDPAKTILIHLRLDDRASHADYDGRICTELYRNKINKNIPGNDHDGEWNIGYCNTQAPFHSLKLQEVIDRAQLEHPGRKVLLLTSPHSKTNLPYETISNDSPEYDLFLLTQTDVIILSRSTYSLMALIFGDHKDSYTPMWGHIATIGLTTKYDRTNFKYFY